MEKEKEKTEPTPEEVKQFRDKQVEFIDSEMPFLQKIVEYEELKARLEIARFERMNAMQQLAHMMAPPTKDSKSEGRKDAS